MKHLPARVAPLVILSLLFISLASLKSFLALPNQAALVNGAWHIVEGSVEQSLIVADGYFMVTSYNKTDKQFISSFGGEYLAEGSQITTKVQFNSADKTQVGKTFVYDYTVNHNIFTTTIDGSKTVWERVDDGQGPLAGNWRITQRKQGDNMSDMPLRARRTLKLLTGTRFQWAAINIETGEFSGTGGGTYTFSNGKYIENIAFFSRDSSRVGASLSFDDKIENGKWIHTGLSSRGDPIYEIWSRMK
ncbi:MAG TPA: hypothetical protein VFV68_10455 [Agriterribacter sp.]|nr:hypothetical protein [Agriterribacter sp.]